MSILPSEKLDWVVGGGEPRGSEEGGEGWIVLPGDRRWGAERIRGG